MIKKYVLALISFLLCINVFGATYYIAPDGNDLASGAIDKPFATVQKAQSVVKPGDIVYLRGGIYHLQPDQIARKERMWAYVTYLDKSGTADAPIKYWAYQNEKPVFDLSEIKPEGLRITVFYVSGSYLQFKGFDVIGTQVTLKGHTQSECFENQGSNNVYEQLNMHDGMAIGFYLLNGSNNLILNCDAYRNWDYFSENGKGGNTDGFGCHPREGAKNNVFKGCRAWFNSDDGYDVINAHEAVTFDHCWAFYNGFSTDFKSLGDGNGFKAGGFARRPASDIPSPVPRHTVQFCLAVRNKASGFYANHHINGDNWYNNSAYKNSINFNMLNRLLDDVSADVPGYAHKLRNNLGYKGGREVTNLDKVKCDVFYNYFDLGLIAADDDFLSLDEGLLISPRQANGSLPDNNFMKLRADSKFIDKGIDVGFPFKGKSPDLGCFECGGRYQY